MNVKLLKETGVNYEKGVDRFSGNKEAYEQALMYFAEDENFDMALAALSKKDYGKAFGYIHNLKGCCGNLDMEELYSKVCYVVEALRGKEAPNDMAEFHNLLSDMTEEYNKVQNGISKAK